MRYSWRNTLCVGTAMAALTACDGKDDITIGARNRTSPALSSFQSCDELAVRLKADLKEELKVQLLQQLEGGYYRGGPVMEDSNSTAGAAPSAESGSQRTEGVDFSGTNNQEAGVDEADLVKTDGYNIFVLNGGRLEILGVPNFGELNHRGTVELEGYPTSMLLAGDRVAVFSQIYTYQLPYEHPVAVAERADGVSNRAESLTKLTVVDVADPANPVAIRELYVEGYFQTARKIDTTARVLSYGYTYIPGIKYWASVDTVDSPSSGSPGVESSAAPRASGITNAEYEELYRAAVYEAIAENNRLIDGLALGDLVPLVIERLADGTLVEQSFAGGNCDNFSIADDGMSHGFTSILSLDLADNGSSFDADHIVSNWSNIYASLDTLIIAEPAQDWWWFWDNEEFEEATNIHRFDISSAGSTTYTGSGRVPGWVMGQFALSEKDDYVRVASTTGQWGRWWMNEPAQAENHVYVLAGGDALDVVGHVGGMGIGERLWSSRFVEDKAYLVTFRSIDPLWTVDLSDPAAPRVLGELEVPGVSTYIHPIAGDHLLTIGFGSDSVGNMDWSTQVSLFDVTNMSEPALDDTYSPAQPAGPNWVWSWSEAQYEHKAFQYWEPKKLLAIPVSTYRGYTNGPYYHYEYFTQLQMISVDADAGLSYYGSVDHSSLYNSDPAQFWYYRDIRRSIFMGEFIYAVSDRGVTAHKLSDLSLSASVQLSGYQPGEYYWYY